MICPSGLSAVSVTQCPIVARSNPPGTGCTSSCVRNVSMGVNETLNHKKSHYQKGTGNGTTGFVVFPGELPVVIPHV